MLKSRRMRWAQHLACMGDFAGEARRKETTRKEENIKMDLRDM
jgi:hypothetical protein